MSAFSLLATVVDTWLVQPIDAVVQPADLVAEPVGDTVESADVAVVQPTDVTVHPADVIVEPAGDAAGKSRYSHPQAPSFHACTMELTQSFALLTWS